MFIILKVKFWKFDVNTENLGNQLKHCNRHSCIRIFLIILGLDRKISFCYPAGRYYQRETCCCCSGLIITHLWITLWLTDINTEGMLNYYLNTLGQEGQPKVYIYFFNIIYEEEIGDGEVLQYGLITNVGGCREPLCLIAWHLVVECNFKNRK